MKGRWNAEERSGVPSSYSILSWLINMKSYWVSSLLHLAWNPCSLKYLHFVTSNYRYISISCVHITDYGSCVLWGKKTKLVWSSVAGNFSMGPLTLPPQQLTRQWQHVPLCDSLLNCTRIFGDFFWQWKQGQHKSRKRKPACCRNVGTAASTVPQEPLLALAILSRLSACCMVCNMSSGLQSDGEVVHCAVCPKSCPSLAEATYSRLRRRLLRSQWGFISGLCCAELRMRQAVVCHSPNGEATPL